MRNPRRALSRTEILDRVWNYNFAGRTSIVDLYISYLRKKIDSGREPMIHTVRGVGYMLRPPECGASTITRQAITWWLPRSLRHQLLLGVLVVVSVVLAAVGVVSVLSLRGYVTAMNDAEVAKSLHAFSHSYDRYREHAGACRHSAGAQALLEFTGQTPGNLIAVLRNGVVIGSAVFSEDEPRPAPPDVVRAIEARSWPDAPPRTEKMGSLGSYRMDCGFEGTDTLVVGVSLNLANRIIARKNITTTALVADALMVTAVLTVWVVGTPFGHCAGSPRPPPRSPRCRSPVTTTGSAHGWPRRTPTRITRSESSETR